MFGYLAEDKDKVNPLIEVLLVFISDKGQIVIDEPMLEDVVVYLLRVAVGANLLPLHFPSLLLFGSIERRECE